MWGDIHPPHTALVITRETHRDGGLVKVAASGQLLSYGELHELIEAVDSALSDSRVRSIEVDVSGVEETGPALSGVLVVLRDLADGLDATLTLHLGTEARRWLPEAG